MSLPRSFASELVAASHENATDAAVTPVTMPADDGEAVMAGDNMTSLPAGLYHIVCSGF